jgi:hypothetical protein
MTRPVTALSMFSRPCDRHWEEGEDLSLLEFTTIEYKRKGYVVATDEQLARITNFPKREFMRRGINQHTLEKICKLQPVRAIKLAECLKVLEEYELHELVDDLKEARGA